MNNDSAEIDELLLQMVNCKNDALLWPPKD